MLRRLGATLSVMGLLLALAAPAVAAPIKGGFYLGHEGVFAENESRPAEGTAIDFRVSRDGRSLRRVSVGVMSKCSNGRFGLSNFLRRRVAVRRDGSFAFSASNLELEPFARSSSVAVKGRFRRSGRAARISLQSRTEGNDGTVCDSGRRALTAYWEPALGEPTFAG